MFSVTLDGDDFAAPVTALAIGQRMDYRSHYQKLLPILATALYAGASGITDVDTDLPEIGELTREGQDYTVTASDARTSVAEMEAYTVAEDGTETLLGTAEGDELGFNFVLEAATTIKVVAKDELGNTQTKEFVIEPASSEVIAQAVEEIIDANQSLATGEYTAESVAALQEKIDTLNALIDDQNTTDAELQKAQAELIAAYRQLKPVDKQAQQEAQAVNDAIDNLLKTMIDVYDLDTTPYKPASIDALNEALSNAELALADPESTAADLKAVNTALLTARKEMEKRTPVTGAKFNTIKAFTYNGKAKKPSVTVTLDGTKLVKGTDYTVRYSNNVKAGKATVTITGKGDYIGTAKTTFTINKAKNPITVATKTAKVKATKVKKANQTLVVTKVLTVKKAQGKVTYVKKSGNKKITINKTTGKVTVKKGLKKGTYKIKVAVKAAGNGNYKAKTVTKTFKIKVS
jgi:hypothetical protein